MKSRIAFADNKVKEDFEKLEDSKSEDQKLHENLVNAFEKLEKNAFSGIQISKNLIPKYYEKRFGEIHNLWKYNIFQGWRLIYTVAEHQGVTFTVIIEWVSHKKYERRFGY